MLFFCKNCWKYHTLSFNVNARKYSNRIIVQMMQSVGKCSVNTVSVKPPSIGQQGGEGSASGQVAWTIVSLRPLSHPGSSPAATQVQLASTVIHSDQPHAVIHTQELAKKFLGNPSWCTDRKVSWELLIVPYKKVYLVTSCCTLLAKFIGIFLLYTVRKVSW